MTVVTIVVSIACFIVGGFASYMFFKHGLKSKYDSILKEAETEAEVIKKNKLLEVKEKFLNKKADLEKEVSLRNQKIQQAENKLKQRELVLNQRQEEIQRKTGSRSGKREPGSPIGHRGQEERGTGAHATPGNRETGSHLRTFCRRSQRAYGRILEGRSQDTGAILYQ